MLGVNKKLYEAGMKITTFMPRQHCDLEVLVS